MTIGRPLPEFVGGGRAAPRAAWIAAIGALALAVLALLNVGRLEFGARHDRADQVDELYFAACAARGTAAGEMPVTSCHDNKPPLVFLLHRFVQRGAPPHYDVLAVKMAAYATLALIAGLVWHIAFRLAGGIAALSATALIAQVFASDAELIALKTETTGALFMLAGIALLVRVDPPARTARVFAAGCLLGLSVLSKQTYAFAAVGVLVWLGRTAHTGARPWARTFVRQGGAFGLGVLAPSALFLLMFALQNRHLDYLYSVLLYPTVYGTASVHPVFKLIAWKVAAVLSALAQTPVLAASFAAAGVGAFRPASVPAQHLHRDPPARLLIVVTAVAMLLVPLAAPNFFTYHLIPAWIMMSIAGGIAVADVFCASADVPPRTTVYLATGLLASALLMAAGSWNSEGSRRGQSDEWSSNARIDAAAGEYAYVLGMWPHFYVYNGLVPASDVMFPWALPGAPPNRAYVPPQPASWRGQALHFAHQQNLRNLMDDFRRTPPSYIVVDERMARSPGSQRVSDVPGFDEYLQAHCRYSRIVGEEGKRSGRLFKCDRSEGVERADDRGAGV